MPTPPQPTTINTTSTIGRHDEDSVDGDQPDSGIDEGNQVCSNTCQYYHWILS